MSKTRQEIFDHVVCHLLTQGEQAMGHVGTDREYCVYRAEDGKKCAVGCLIPDELYSPLMETLGISEIVDKWKGLEFMEPHFTFLRALQNLHDHSIPPLWRQGLRDLARQFGLKYHGH